jgi:hypothetical protein
MNEATERSPTPCALQGCEGVGAVEMQTYSFVRPHRWPPGAISPRYLRATFCSSCANALRRGDFALMPVIGTPAGQKFARDD